MFAFLASFPGIAVLRSAYLYYTVSSAVAAGAAYPTLATQETIRTAFMTFALALFAAIPLGIYTLWALFSAYQGCGSCHSRDVIPALSPEGQRIKDRYQQPDERVFANAGAQTVQ